jgi:pimeloyl-ACP methyl ester carboxylesterase
VSKPQLMLLPGLLNDAELWRDQIAGLSDLADIAVADLTRLEGIACLAAGVLAAAAPTFALAGFSFGGYVAQEILRQAPQRVERLALLDTSIRVDTPQRAMQRRALNKAAASDGHFVGMTDRMLETYIDHSRLGDADLTGRIRAMTERLGREVFLRQNSAERDDGEAALRAYPGPTVIVCGDNDALTPLPLSREMAQIADCPLVIIEGSGHMTPMERPQAVTAALRDWLRA